MTITPSQYYAILEVAENGERFKTCDLNILPQTFKAILSRGWIDISNGYASVTSKAWEEIS